MEDYGGVVTWNIIYNEIEKYYPNAKKSDSWQEGLRGVLYRDIGKKFQRIEKSTFAPIDYNIINLIPKDLREGVTEKNAWVKVRVLQQKYREKLLKELKFCPVTKISDKRLLIASHIKPWSMSDDTEKTDVMNGFILSPLYDRLFDTGLITFSADKKMHISSTVSETTKKSLGLYEHIIPDLPVDGRETYLEFHNKNRFTK